MGKEDAQRCCQCNEVLQRGVEYRGRLWHKKCFKCCSCGGLLAGIKFFNNNNQHYCTQCFAHLFEDKCFACRQPITGIGDVFKIAFDQQHWHPQCFVCSLCKSPLVGQLVVQTSVGITCTKCAVSSSIQ